MLSNRLLSSLLSILFLCHFLPAKAQKTVKISKTPSWVSYQDFNPNPNVDEDEISQGSLSLLADYQINIPRQERYFRYASKVMNTVGVQESSNISAEYDPSFQELEFHSINIIRNGEVINKLNPEHFQVIRRELNAEKYLYDGSYTALLNLSDVRVGDIIDMSFTIKGFNPIHNGNYSELFYLSDYVPIGKINITLVTERALNYKLFNTDLKPEILKSSGSIIYNWQVTTPNNFKYEEYLPTWQILLPTVVVSDYGSWEEVVQWAEQLFKQDEAMNNGLKSKIEEIRTTHKTDGEKIQAVLDFVQNDVRYLGLEYGIGSYKPNSYNKVFDQRYGDCKDKSLLMSKILTELDIKASPMLVNTSLKNTILDLPPSPEFFDHCVVKVVDNNNHLFYYDPTINEQYGSYAHRHFPNYEYGLEIKSGIKSFDTIVSKSTNNITTLEEFEIKDLKGKATLSVTTTYSNVEADQMRSYITNTSKSTYHQELENFYSNFYDHISLSKDPIFEDNQSENELTIREFYSIDSIWNTSKDDPKKIEIEFVPASLVDILVLPNLDNRKHPFEMPYPVAREHEFRIKLPQPWSIVPSNDLITNDIFYYESEFDYNSANYEVISKSYLKIQKPIVEVSEFDTFNRDIALLEQSYGVTIFIDKDVSPDNFDSSLASLIGKVIAIIILSLLIIGIVALATRKSKRT